MTFKELYKPEPSPFEVRTWVEARVSDRLDREDEDWRAGRHLDRLDLDHWALAE